MLAITYKKITKIKAAEWGTPKKKIFFLLEIFENNRNNLKPNCPEELFERKNGETIFLFVFLLLKGIL